MKTLCKSSAILFASLLAFNLFTFSPFHLFAAEPVQVRSVRVIAGPDVAHLVHGAPLVIEEWQYHDLGVGQPIVREPYGKIAVGSSPVSMVYDLAPETGIWIASAGTNEVRVAPLDPGTVSRFGIVSCAALPTVEVWSPTRQSWTASVATNGALCVSSPYPLPYSTMRAVGTVGADGALDIYLRRFASYGSSAMSATSGTARVRITWTPAGMPGLEAYAPLPLAAAPTNNAIIAVTADLDGNGQYSPGEPYGVYQSGAVPAWRPTVTLTGTSPVSWRIDLADAIANNTFDAQRLLNDRGVLGYAYTNIHSRTLDIKPAGAVADIRFCGISVNGISMRKVGATSTTYYGFRSLSQTARLFDMRRGPLTEAQVYELGYKDAAADYVSDTTMLSDLGIGNATNVGINILIDHITQHYPLTNNVLATTFVNYYESERSLCIPATPAGTIFPAGRDPVFRWSCAANKEYAWCSLRIYTAAVDGERVAGMLMQPARRADGTYELALPLRVGWQDRLGGHMTTNEYWWSVSMIDAKYPSSDPAAIRTPFRLSAD